MPFPNNTIIYSQRWTSRTDKLPHIWHIALPRWIFSNLQMPLWFKTTDYWYSYHCCALPLLLDGQYCLPVLPVMFNCCWQVLP